MNILISIESDEAQFTLRSIGQRQVKEQICYVTLPDSKHPQKMKFNLPGDREAAYPVGEYVVSPKSYRIGKYGNLELNPFELVLEKLPMANKPAVAPQKAA